MTTTTPDELANVPAPGRRNVGRRLVRHQRGRGALLHWKVMDDKRGRLRGGRGGPHWWHPTRWRQRALCRRGPAWSALPEPNVSCRRLTYCSPRRPLPWRRAAFMQIDVRLIHPCRLRQRPSRWGGLSRGGRSDWYDVRGAAASVVACTGRMVL